MAGISVGTEPTATQFTTALTGPQGIVDLSEPPELVAEPPAASSDRRARDLVPGPLLAAAEVASWLPPDYRGTSVNIELRNNCSLDFRFAFGANEGPAAEQPARPLAAHTLEIQRVVPGQWLHLWNGDRWLGSAMTTVDGARMDISPDCNALELNFELDDRGPTSFAIHWELDADESLAPATPASAKLAAEAQDQPELWGPTNHEDRVELRLANFCAETIEYAFTPDLDADPEHPASLAGHSEKRVEIPATWWLRYQAIDEGWRGGATTSLDGGVVWVSANCVDFGVADNQTIRP